MFNSFGQNTAEFYDKHILLSIFGLKPRYFALHLMEKKKVFF